MNLGPDGPKADRAVGLSGCLVRFKHLDQFDAPSRELSCEAKGAGMKEDHLS